MPVLNKNELHTYLSKFGQEHLLNYWDSLDEIERECLCEELKQINFEEITKFYHDVKTSTNEAIKKLDEHMQPIANELKGSFVKSTPFELKYYELRGLQAISNNEVAVVLLAGGQGTRLGVSYPKGMCSVNLLSGKTLYQLQAERLLRVQQLAAEKTGRHGTVPWYIMTSEHTKESTDLFFKKNNHFGLDEKNISFFEQSNLPCLTVDGKIILDEKFIISKSPDGNGGLYRALLRQNVLDDMKKRGIKYIHVYCVDNILVKMADPVFIGFCIEKDADCAAKVVKKTVPQEPVGVICKVNNHYQVVEYSEISPKTAQERSPDGELKFNAGNICNHFFTYEFLNDICRNNESNLKHHVALKKIPYVDEHGVRQKPLKPNGIKLEKFVFDIFQFARNFAIWEVLREDEFSPLKNANGGEKDTPTTCRSDLVSLHHRWLIEAGAQFHHEPGTPIPFIQSRQEYSDQIISICEVSPLISYAGEGLSKYVNGRYFEPPLVLEYDHSTNKVTFNGLDIIDYNNQHRNLPNPIVF